MLRDMHALKTLYFPLVLTPVRKVEQIYLKLSVRVDNDGDVPSLTGPSKVRHLPFYKFSIEVSGFIGVVGRICRICALDGCYIITTFEICLLRTGTRQHVSSSSRVHIRIRTAGRHSHFMQPKSHVRIVVFVRVTSQGHLCCPNRIPARCSACGKC